RNKWKKLNPILIMANKKGQSYWSAGRRMKWMVSWNPVLTWNRLFSKAIIKCVDCSRRFSGLFCRLQHLRLRQRQWRLPMTHFTAWARVYGHVILIQHIALDAAFRQVVSGQIAITNILHMRRLAAIKNPVSAEKIIL